MASREAEARSLGKEVQVGTQCPWAWKVLLTWWLGQIRKGETPGSTIMSRAWDRDFFLRPMEVPEICRDLEIGSLWDVIATEAEWRGCWSHPLSLC